VPQIVLTTVIPAQARACFDLSLSVDAHTASMANSGERVVGGVTSGAMTLGDTVSWRARHFGIPFTMTSRISEYDAPHRFVDEQVSGPFGRWWHEHRFEEHDGSTVMTDTVDFASPLGPVGRAVDRMFLTGYLTRLLEQRNVWLVESLS
jgi:ligand-binding SRPBCC domain-containing protein